MNENSKLFAIISYITWIGFIVALVARDKNDSLVRRHLNNALILNIISTVAGLVGQIGGILSILGGIVGIACFVFMIIGIVRAAQASEEPLPVIGGIELIK
ncbi:MAG: hypothetical protein IKO80_05630 [Lachnospiraceae bacterium]|nr:hypothetical protein [Lachnospiraceae bacterium]